MAAFLRKPRLAFLTTCLLLATFAAKGQSSGPTPVLILVDGDDGLTQRLGDAVKHKFKASAGFSASTAETPDTLIVTIPTNVHWQRIGGRTKLLNKVDFTFGHGNAITTKDGVCWEDQLTNCADQVLKIARNTVAQAK